MNSIIIKSVKSINSCASLPGRQAGVIQTIYDIVKAHGGELKVETRLPDGQGRRERGVSLLFNYR